MKKKSILIIVAIIIIICLFLGVTYIKFNNNIDLEYNKSEIDTDDTVEFKSGEYSYSIELTDSITIDNLLDEIFNESPTTDDFELLSNSDESVIKYDNDKKEFISLSEGTSDIKFKLDNQEITIRFSVFDQNK